MRKNDPTTARPIVVVQLSKNDNPLAVFMHATLRPILKQKHDILCAVIRNNKILNTNILASKTELQNMALLKQFFQKNAALKNVLIGIIIGSFTIEELEFYFQYQKESNRRILEMIIARFLSEFQNH